MRVKGQYYKSFKIYASDTDTALQLEALLLHDLVMSNPCIDAKDPHARARAYLDRNPSARAWKEDMGRYPFMKAWYDAFVNESMALFQRGLELHRAGYRLVEGERRRAYKPDTEPRPENTIAYAVVDADYIEYDKAVRNIYLVAPA